jgi:hypothetical protein
MTSGNDDVTDRILKGTAYDQATATVRRTFPLRIAGKIYVAIGILAVSGLLAPALYLSRDRIRTFGATETLSGTFSLTMVTLALLGVAVTFGAGLLLVRQLYAVHQRALSEPEARRLVRTEDVLMWFVAQGGAFVLIPVGLAVTGFLSASTVETLYGYGVTVYQPSRTVGVDARLVSVLGVGLAAVLYGLYRVFRE